MNRPPSSLPLALLALLILTSAAFADGGSAATEGGNITNANLSGGFGNSTWHGVVGLTSSAAFGSMTISTVCMRTW